MLKNMGVLLIEIPLLRDPAVYVDDIETEDGTTSVLIVRAGLSPSDLAQAAEMVLLDCAPQQRRSSEL